MIEQFTVTAGAFLMALLADRVISAGLHLYGLRRMRRLLTRELREAHAKDKVNHNLARASKRVN